MSLPSSPVAPGTTPLRLIDAPAFLGPVGRFASGLIGSIGGAVLGGLKWTSALASKFILATLAGLVQLLIPRSWIHAGLSIMHWLVAVPDYSAQITSPSGAHVYGFAGINDLRQLFVWIAIALLPLTLVYASSRAIFGLGDHVALPVLRTLVIATGLLSYTYIWRQLAAISNQLTSLILGVPAVTEGIQKLFTFIVTGGALVGFQFVGLLVMAAAAIALLMMLFLKVIVILVGALVYAIGPLMLAIAPTERGEAIARGWLTIAIGLFVLPVLWATVFAVSALLINDSGGAAVIIATSGTLGKLLGGLVLALAGIAGFWLNIKLTKAAAAVMGGQVSAMLALASSSRHAGGGSSRT